MSTITEKLQERRKECVQAMTEATEMAVAHSRGMSSGEQKRYDEAHAEVTAIDERLEHMLAGERRAKATEEAFAELRGRPVERGGPAQLSEADRELDRAFRSAIRSKNPAPIEIPPTRTGYSNPGIERRDLLKTTATQALPVSVYDRVVQHMLESSAVLKAGATVINTETGEDLQVPKSTAFSTSTLTTEGSSITESDPTLAVVTLKSYKYPAFFQVSSELAADGNADLLGFLSRQAAEALAQAYGAHLMTGTGTGQPSGAIVGAAPGVTGPAGTGTSLGAQGTAGQGTDLLNSLAGSVAEPYANSNAAAFLLRNASLTVVRNLKTTTGDLVGNSYIAQSPYPFYVDPFVPAMANTNESIIFGDWSRYFVRIAGGLRFERSDDFAFQNDLVSFRAIIRLDGALVDTSALKTFVNTT